METTWDAYRRVGSAMFLVTTVSAPTEAAAREIVRARLSATLGAGRIRDQWTRSGEIVLPRSEAIKLFQF